MIAARSENLLRTAYDQQIETCKKKNDHFFKLFISEIGLHIFSYLNREQMGKCCLVSKKWNEIINDSLDNLEGQMAKEFTEKNIGKIKEEIIPKVPKGIHQILSRPCPFWPGKKVKETHRFFLVPEKIQDKPFNLKNWNDFLVSSLKINPLDIEECHRLKDLSRQHPFQPDENLGITNVEDCLKKIDILRAKFKSSSLDIISPQCVSELVAGKIHWLLLAKSITPESRKKEDNFQQTKLTAKIAGDYEEVNLLDFVFCNSMVLISDRKNPLRDPHVSNKGEDKASYPKSGLNKRENDSLLVIRCQEKKDHSQINISISNANSILIYDERTYREYYADTHKVRGIVAARKFY